VPRLLTQTDRKVDGSRETRKLKEIEKKGAKVNRTPTGCDGEEKPQGVIGRYKKKIGKTGK